MSDVTKQDWSYLPAAPAMLARAAARPRAVIALSIAGLSSLGWIYLGLRHEQHADIFAVICRPLAASGLTEFAVMLAMWIAMVFAMMLPSAAATILTYAEIADTAGRKNIAVVSPIVLGAGYTLVWIGFALAAATAQVSLARLALFDQTTGSLNVAWSGGLFIAAGAYQFSALKQACLRQCRNPFGFFFTNWTTTARGVFRLGVKQGLFCLGCCIAAMLLMFALGVMNILWMAVLAAAMTVEKLVNSARLSYGFGVVLMALGIALISGVGID
jgi:predicted metal-binding membrane protein